MLKFVLNWLEAKRKGYSVFTALTELLKVVLLYSEKEL